MQPTRQGQTTLLIQKQYYGAATKKRGNIANKNLKINHPLPPQQQKKMTILVTT